MSGTTDCSSSRSSRLHGPPAPSGDGQHLALLAVSAAAALGGMAGARTRAAAGRPQAAAPRALWPCRRPPLARQPLSSSGEAAGIPAPDAPAAAAAEQVICSRGGSVLGKKTTLKSVIAARAPCSGRRPSAAGAAPCGRPHATDDDQRPLLGIPKCGAAAWLLGAGPGAPPPRQPRRCSSRATSRGPSRPHHRPLAGNSRARRGWPPLVGHFVRRCCSDRWEQAPHPLPQAPTGASSATPRRRTRRSKAGLAPRAGAGTAARRRGLPRAV